MMKIITKQVYLQMFSITGSQNKWNNLDVNSNVQVN